MPAERLSMKKIRDVLRLTHAMGMSRRLVGEATGIGKTAVGEYVRRAAVAGLSWPIPNEIDDAELEQRLFPPTDAVSSAARNEPDWSHIHAELKRRGVTLALLWQEYRAASVPHGCATSPARCALRTTLHPSAETTSAPARHHQSRSESANSDPPRPRDARTCL